MAKKKADHKFSRGGTEDCFQRQPGACISTNARPLESLTKKLPLPKPDEADCNSQFMYESKSKGRR